MSDLISVFSCVGYVHVAHTVCCFGVCPSECAALIKPLVLLNPALPDQDLVNKMKYKQGTFTIHAMNFSVIILYSYPLSTTIAYITKWNMKAEPSLINVQVIE